jgi:hypothetical protein
VIRIYGRAVALRPAHYIRIPTTHRRRAPHPPPHILAYLTRRHLHRRSHLSVSLLVLRSAREIKDMWVQPGRSLCGRGVGVADGFVGAQEGSDLCGRGEAGEEVSKDGCIFDLD